MVSRKPVLLSDVDCEAALSGLREGVRADEPDKGLYSKVIDVGLRQRP